MQLVVWLTPSENSLTANFQPSLLRRATLVGTRSPYSLPFVILPVPARSPFRFIRHRRRSTPNLKEGAFWIVQPPPKSCPRLRGKWTRTNVSGRKGCGLEVAYGFLLFPLSHGLRRASSPACGGAFWTPSVKPSVCQLPLRGSLLAQYKLKTKSLPVEGGGFCEAKDGGS